MKILNKADAIEDPTDKWPQAEPDNRDFEDILGGSLNLTGVVSGCAVTAQGTPDMTVAVASGVAIVGGTSATVSAGNVTITAAGASPRFDLICVSSAGVKSAVLGTGASNPVFPDPAGKAVLAAVYVPGSDTDIDANQIVDKRVIIKPWTQLSGDTMTGSLTLAPTSGVAPVVEIQGNAAAGTLRVSSYGDVSATSPQSQMILRRMRGTVAAPLRTKALDSMGRIGGTGATAADDVSTATLSTSPKSYIDFRASEAFTATAVGSEIRFVTTPLLSTTAAERIRLKSTGEFQMDDISGFASNFNSKIACAMESTNRTATIAGGRGTIYGRIRRYGGGIVTDIDFGLYASAGDHSTAAQVSITGAANNGSGLIRLTCASHPFVTGDRVGVGNVGGVTNANNAWTITRISATQFDLQGSTFAGVYTSGGSATSAGSIYGVYSHVQPTVTRVLSSATGSATDGDDVAAFAAYNGGTAKGMECFYVGSNASFAGASQWTAGLGVAADVDWGVRISTASTCLNAGLAFHGPITSGIAIDMGTALNIKTDTTTGSKIGTATNEKLAFHNSTPVIQKASAAQAAVATTGAVNTTPYGYTTAAQADAIVTLVNELRAALVEKGLIKGSA